MAIYTTPLATDQYSRVMAGIFDESKIVPGQTAWLSFFGRGMGSETLYSDSAKLVEIDIMRAGELELAQMIHRGGMGDNSDIPETNAGKFSTFGRAFPLIEEKSSINADELLDSQAGESSFSGKLKIERLREQALRLHTLHVQKTQRTMERLAMQSIQTGKMDYILGTIDNDWQFDFLRLATHTTTAGSLWTSGAQTIDADADTICALGFTDAHVKYDMAVMGSLAMDAFIKDTTIATRADNRRIGWIDFTLAGALPPRYQRFVDGGMMWRGIWKTPAGYELYVFTYIGHYYAGGVNVDWMPSKKVLYTSSDVRCDRYYGPSERLPVGSAERAWYQETFGFSMDAPPMPSLVEGSAANINPSMFYFDAYQSPDRKTLKIRTQSAPIFVPVQTDAFHLFTVLA